MLTHIATAIMFLTRIPVGNAGSGDPEDLAASTQYFPLIGVLIGVLVFAAFSLAHVVWPTEVAIVISIIIAVMLTGGFHEDGLADVADSAGAWTKERKLEIMRDSRVGTYGALALVLSLLLKYVSLVAIANAEPVVESAFCGLNMMLLCSLLLGHVLGRWSTLPMIRLSRYARDSADNKVIAKGVTNQRLVVGSAIALLVVLFCGFIMGSLVLLSVIATCVVVLIAKWRFEYHLGGVTGDCLGATNQIVELVVYLSLISVVT